MKKNRVLLLIITLVSTQALFSSESTVGGEINTTSSFNQRGGVSTDIYGLGQIKVDNKTLWALGTWDLGNTGNKIATNVNFQNSWTSEMGIVAKSFVTLKAENYLAIDWSAANFQLTDAHLEMQGFMFSPGATVWGGLTEDYSGVHINGLGYRKFSGLGFGIRGYRVGDTSIDLNFYDVMNSMPAKYIPEDNPNAQSLYNMMTLQTKAAIPIFLGTLEVELAGHIVPDGEKYARVIRTDEAVQGIQGGIFLETPKFFKLDSGNTKWGVQVGYGLPTGKNLGQSHFWDAGYNKTLSTRVIYSGLLDTEKFQIMSTIAFQYDKDINEDGDSRTMLSAGARPILQLKRNIALMSEYGLEYIKDLSLSGASNTEELEGILHKATLAIALTLDKGFWARPQFRLFTTFSTWDKELNSVFMPEYTTFGDDKNMAIKFGINMTAWY